jgi:hypothetical protein
MPTCQWKIANLLVPERNHAQALSLSAWQGILEEFVCEILAIQVEGAILQSASCCLYLICPNLWRTMRHFPCTLDIAGLRRQLHSV